jgi:hypothetical protein
MHATCFTSSAILYKRVPFIVALLEESHSVWLLSGLVFELRTSINKVGGLTTCKVNGVLKNLLN